MLSTGIVRRVDELGRVVIPKEIRRKLNIKEGDPLELHISEDSVVFRPYRSDVADGLEALLRIVNDDIFMDSAEKIKVAEILQNAIGKIQECENNT